MRRKEPVSKYQGSTIRHRQNGTFAVDFWHEGKRKRKVFVGLSEAKTQIDQWRIEARNRGLAAFSLADRDRMDVSDFRKNNRSIMLSAVFNFWMTHHPGVETRTIHQIIGEFLSPKTLGVRGKKSIVRRKATIDGHLKRLANNEGAFSKIFGAMQAHEVTPDGIETWLNANAWTGLNRRHYLSAVRALFAFAVRKGYVVTNPAEKIETPEAVTAEPVIMTVKDVEKYLASIETTVIETCNKATGVKYRVECADLLPREAMAFFCGLRPEELNRLDWRNVSIENRLITVTGDVAKVQGHRRNVTMPDNLVAWLVPYIRAAGPVWPHRSPTTLSRYRAIARKAAGVDVPDNAGRHAFASYHLAAYDNAPETAERMGHSDIKLLRNTYRNIVASDGRPITKASGEAYFKIMPHRDASVVWFRQTA